MEIRLQCSVPTWGPYLPALFRHCTNIITVYVNMCTRIEPEPCQYFTSIALYRIRYCISKEGKKNIVPALTHAGDSPANRKHLYNICTTSAHLLPRCSNIVQRLYKCFVLVACWPCPCTRPPSPPPSSLHALSPGGDCCLDHRARQRL